MAELTGVQQFLTYVKSLNVQVLNKLYESPATCVAILRYLPALVQMFIMRMVFVDQPIPVVIVESWLTTRNKKDFGEVLSTLRSLNLIQDDVTHSKCLSLTTAFKLALRNAILTGKLSGVEEIAVEEKYKKSIGDLENYGVERWECVLKYLALPSSETEKTVSQESRQVLQAAEFIAYGKRGEAPEITTLGFKFLLTDRTSQLWIYLLHYLRSLENKSGSIVEPLTFLFHLSFCSTGKAYSSKNLSDYMEDFLQQLREIGIVFQRKRKSGWFYPTPLALMLSQAASDQVTPLTGGLDQKSNSGFIVVETNYRVYAYTKSTLQLAIISTFVDTTCRFDNLTVGTLSRESVRKALQVGITSKQIIQYLKCNAHPIMLNSPSIIPPVICDQLRLWELERDRFRFDDGALYSNFVSEQEFQAFRNHAIASDFLLWENANSRLLVIRNDGIEPMKQFYRRQNV